MSAFIKKGKRPGIDSLLVGTKFPQGFPPQPSGSQYQYGTHEAAIKGSQAGGYGVTFGAMAALAVIAIAQHRPVFAQTLPQDPQYQASYVNAPSPALYAVSNVAPPLKGIIQSWPQENQQQAPSSIWGIQQNARPIFGPILTAQQPDLQTPPSSIFQTTLRLQRPVWSAIITTPQIYQYLPGSIIWTIKAGSGLQTPLPQPIIQTLPQEDQQLRPSSVYGAPPASQQAVVPPLTSALVTQAQQPDTTQSLVKTTNIALALEAPALRPAIVTQAEQPLPAPSMVVISTALIPSFVAGSPATRAWMQTWPQDQSAFEVNYSFVDVPNAALLPSAPVNLNVPQVINLSLSLVRLGGMRF